MTTEPAITTDQSGATGTASLRPRPSTALSPRRPWLLGALLLAGCAQLITISALLSVDPLAVSWWSLLLAIAPAPLAAAAAFAPAVLARAAAGTLAVVLIAGIVGGSCTPACSSCRPWLCSLSAAVRCGASGPDPVRDAAHMRLV